MAGMSTPDIIRDQALSVAEAHEAFSARVALAHIRYHNLMAGLAKGNTPEGFPRPAGEADEYVLVAYTFNSAGLLFRNSRLNLEYIIPYDYFKDPDEWEKAFLKNG